MSHTILFSINGFNFYTHGVFAVVGIIFAIAATYILANKRLKRTYLLDNIIYSIFAGIIGARLTYVILYSDQFASPLQYLYLWEGGLVSYGGFIAGGLFFAYLLKRQKSPVLPWFDLLAISFPLGLFFGRLGEYVSGENFGVPVPGRETAATVPIHLYEAGLCLGIAFLLFVLYALAAAKIKKGVFLSLSVMLYTAGRFAIDMWRDEAKIAAGLSLGQITSLVLFFLFFTLMLTITLSKRKGSYEPVS